MTIRRAVMLVLVLLSGAAFGAANEWLDTEITGYLTVSGQTTLSGDLAINPASPDITTTATGTGSVFNTNLLTLNIGGAATTIAIGTAAGTTTIAGTLQVTKNADAGHAMIIDNQNGGTAAFARYEARNGAAEADAMKMLCMGTAWTTTGAFVQDGGVLEAGANLAGGLSIMARHSSGVIRFYSGGAAAGDLALTLDTSADATLVGNLAVNGGDITTTDTTANVFNSPTTASAFTGATTLTLGGSTTSTIYLAPSGSAKIAMGLTGAPQFNLEMASDDSTVWAANSYSGTATSGSFWSGQRARGTRAAITDVQDGDSLVTFQGSAYSGAFMASGLMTVEVDGTFTSGQRPPGRLVFKTTVANGSLTERLRITGAGDTVLSGRLRLVSVTDAGPMTATNGTEKDLVYNESDSKVYVCTVTGTPGTWAALN